jgi:peroxiredoxin
MSLLGEQAPDFTLENTAGKEITLSETLDRGPTVVVMFRAGWCSFCAEQLQTFSSLSYDLWHNHDTDVLAVSSDSLGNLAEMRDRFDLRIQLLSDPEFTATRAYTDVVEHDRRDDYTRAGTFVIDPDGTVRYEQIADAAADRTYANYVRYFIKRGYEDHYETTSGRSV